MIPSTSTAEAASRAARVRVRLATARDLARIEALQVASLRALGKPYYSTGQIESLIRFVPMMDRFLISDGGYFVAELDGNLVGCGGWSERVPGYRPYQGDPEHTPGGKATVRAMYVHPNAARCGIGRMLLTVAETAMVRAGHSAASLDATLPGVALYARCGWRPTGESQLELPDGISVPIVVMHKRLAPASAKASTP